MKMQYKIMVALTIVASSLAAGAATVTAQMKAQRASADAPVVVGQWHAGFTKVKNYAVNNGLPLLAIWSNGEDCSHCKKLEKNLLRKEFKEYMAQSGVVFYFGCNEDKSQDDKYGGTAYNWCWKNQSLNLFPFVRFYWKAKKGTVLADGTVLTADKVLVDTAMTGDKFDNWKEVSDGGYKYCISKAKSMFKQYVYQVASDYKGGEFAFEDFKCSRLQAEEGLTTEADFVVPFTRTNSAALASEYVNKVVQVNPDKSVKTNELAWAVGDGSATVKITLPSVKANVGKQVTLILLDDENSPVATNHIDIVAKQENAPSNPLWKGKTFAAGQWTMDYEKAVERTVKGDFDAMLVLVSGSQWCPDCVAVDKWLLEQADFKSWTEKKNLACVTIDIPKVGAQEPSLLGYQSYHTDTNADPKRALRYCTYNYSSETNDDLRVVGGAGYRSRNMISDEEAKVVFDRNQELFTNAVDNAKVAGLCRPECLAADNVKTSQFKTGIPALILMRRNGKGGLEIAGRIFQFNNVSPNCYKAVYMKRLDELLGQVALKDEESNDDILTANEELTIGSNLIDRSLSFVDPSDYYPICTNALNSVVSLTLVGSSAATVTVSIVQRQSNGKEKELYSSTKLLTDSPWVQYQIPSTNCFAKVSYPVDKNRFPTDPWFAFEKDGSTLCPYTLKSDIVLTPEEAEKNWEIKSGDKKATVMLTESETYWFTDLDESAPDFATYLDKGSSDKTYKAKVTAPVELTFTADTFSYRIWKAGKVGFSMAADTVSEGVDGVYKILIRRTGGMAGTAYAKIHLDPASTNYVDTVEFEDDGREFTWANNDDKTVYEVPVVIVDNKSCDGDQRVKFYLDQKDAKGQTVPCDAGLDVKNFVLTIKEGDKAVPGKLTLGGCMPLEAKPGEIYAASGSEITLAVDRIGGSTGELTGELVMSKGLVGTIPVAFENREADTLFQKVSLADATSDSVKIVLNGKNGTKVVSGAKTLTVKIVDADAPRFTQEAMSCDAVRYVKINETAVELDPNYCVAGDTVKKVSGTLPNGITARFDGVKQLSFSGIPTKAGTFAAVYQVFRGKKPGLVFKIDFTVADPAATTDGGRTPALNPAVAKTRTYTDLRLIDGDGKHLIGLMDLQVPRTGKISAKLRMVGTTTTVSFMSKSWSTCSDAGDLESKISGVTAGFQTLSMTVKAKATGVVCVEDIDFETEYKNLSCEIPVGAFSSSVKTPECQGLYTVSLKPVAKVGDNDPLATGYGYVTMKMTSKQIATGALTYAGMLPNGKTFSGSAKLIPRGFTGTDVSTWTDATMPLMLRSATDCFAGVLRIDRDEADKYGTWNRHPVRDEEAARPCWWHTVAASAVSYAVDMDAWGGKYDSTENLIDCCEGRLDTAKLTLFALTDDLIESDGHGKADKWDAKGHGVKLTWNMTKKINTIATQASPAPGFTLTFDRTTGIVSGKIRIKTQNGADSVTADYRAVVLPGYGSGGCTDCGGDPEAVNRPFISGSAWFNDSFDFEDATGRARTINIKLGCPVTIGEEAGK